MKYFFSLLLALSSLPIISQKSAKDSVPNQILAYKMYYDYSGMYQLPIDSTLLHFQIYNYAFTDFSVNPYLGNLGTAVNPILKLDNAGGYDLIFNKYVRYNFFLPSDVIYYKTKSPFTNLTYYTAGPKTRQEQYFQFLNTQNVNKYWNLGFQGKLIYSDGEYLNSLVKGNSFIIFSSYNGLRYNLNVSVHLNTLKTTESGGVLPDSTNDPTYTLPVKLQGANSINKNFSIFLQQRLYLTGSYKEDSTKTASRWNDVISVVHRLQFERSSRKFNDDLTASYGNFSDANYFNKIYIDSLTTGDSAYFRRFENNLLLAINALPLIKVPAELRFGIKNQLDKVSYSTPIDTLIKGSNRYSDSYINSALVGTLTNRFSKTLQFGASGELYFTGYKAGNIYLSGDLTKSIRNNFILYLKGDFCLEKTPYFLQNYESNHFIWHNAFTAKQSITNIKASFTHTKLRITLEGETGSFINYLYFDRDTLPKMSDQPFTMLRLSAKKYFKWKVLNTMLRVTLQKSTDEEVMPLPLFSGFNTSFV